MADVHIGAAGGGMTSAEIHAEIEKLVRELCTLAFEYGSASMALKYRIEALNKQLEAE